MIQHMSDVENKTIIVSSEKELPATTIFGTMALIIETGEIKIFDEEWKTL